MVWQDWVTSQLQDGHFGVPKSGGSNIEYVGPCSMRNMEKSENKWKILRLAKSRHWQCCILLSFNVVYYCIWAEFCHMILLNAGD